MPVPYVSRVDAGTMELVRSFGVDVVSSADLIQLFEARWTDRQLESHQYAAAAFRRIVDEVFDHVRRVPAKGRGLTEYGLQHSFCHASRTPAWSSSPPSRP